MVLNRGGLQLVSGGGSRAPLMPSVMPHLPMDQALLFEARIADEGIAALRGMIGLAPQQLFSPGVTVEDDFIYSPSFSIPADGQCWLIIENSWLETAKEYIDYYQISVSSSPKPKDISIG